MQLIYKFNMYIHLFKIFKYAKSNKFCKICKNIGTTQYNIKFCILIENIMKFICIKPDF